MKRVFVVDEHISSKQNGVGTYLKYLIAILKDMDAEVNLISFNDEVKHFAIFEGKSARTYRFPVFNGGLMLESGGLCWPLLKMHVADSKDNVFMVNHSPCLDFLKSLRHHYHRSEIVFTIHDQGWTSPLLGDSRRLHEVISMCYSRKKKYEKERFCKKYFQEELRIYRIADKVVCLSACTRDLLREVYQVPDSKTHFILNGITFPERTMSPGEIRNIKIELGIGDHEHILLYVGRMVEAKGIKDLLQAFENLWKRNSGLRLAIAGEVFNLNELVKLTPNSATHVTYLGMISKERLQKWYEAADIGVLPSYTEQCSYTGLEMMANKLLIVTTDGNGLRDMFRHNENALVAKIDEHFLEHLEDTLDKALHLGEAERQRIIMNAFCDAKTFYSTSQMKEGYRTLLFDESEYPTI